MCWHVDQSHSPETDPSYSGVCHLSLEVKSSARADQHNLVMVSYAIHYNHYKVHFHSKESVHISSEGETEKHRKCFGCNFWEMNKKDTN